MLTFYLIIVIILFILAISDLVVGVSNDAVNFLNSAVGAKAATFKLILAVAALGIVVGCTFSSGMMEVARKGIFHPEHFYFSEIILLFLAVMVTDVILLDAFNTFGMPTSTTVSIVFELLGAAVAFSVIKISTDPQALGLGEYINSAKALAIISGILLSVVVAFTAGVILQYLTRLLFSFDYERRLRTVGPIWGGLAISAITYFMLIKGAKGTSFMDDAMKTAIQDNAMLIIAGSFVAWTVILYVLTWLTRVNILKLIVLVGTFALAMAFAGNDLVNFIGVPLAGYNSYEMYVASGAAPDGFLMEGLAGKVPTPTLLLLLAGVIMTITLWTSKKARTVVQTSLDLGRQYEGTERFTSFAVSRSLVRGFSKMAYAVNNVLPKRVRQHVLTQFDERPFLARQAHLGKEAPSFDMIRAAVTLVVASILIAIGTALKLPLSTTYVTFMVFMGTSLADGAWGRESAVYRVSGVISVIGGWFFTAFSAFTVAFIVACIFHFGGPVAIVLVLAIAAYTIYRTHRYHGKRVSEQQEIAKMVDEGDLTKDKVIDKCVHHLTEVLGAYSRTIADAIDGLAAEDLNKLNETYRAFKKIDKKTTRLKHSAGDVLDRLEEDGLEAGHMYMLVVDYLNEMSSHVGQIIKPSLQHVDNNHKPLLPEQIEELREIYAQVDAQLISTINVFRNPDRRNAASFAEMAQNFVKDVRATRKRQIKRIKNNLIGTRNSLLYLNHLGELRNISLFSQRLVKVFTDLILEEPATPSETDGAADPSSDNGQNEQAVIQPGDTPDGKD
ncbi:MAG: inorganic phosphate transporter [Saprospiraceae bacterium]|nr:inorganic phosphate transporter [Saprospiraceae bacterium]